MGKSSAIGRSSFCHVAGREVGKRRKRPKKLVHGVDQSAAQFRDRAGVRHPVTCGSVIGTPSAHNAPRIAKHIDSRASIGTRVHHLCARASVHCSAIDFDERAVARSAPATITSFISELPRHSPMQRPMASDGTGGKISGR
jgi:hypothetical protein